MAPRGGESDRERDKQKYKARIASAINEDDDPLAVYYQFIQWTIKNYGENDPNSGLKDLLTEAAEQFKEDDIYKTDLRYLKVWALRARQTDKLGAIAIYASLVDRGIGTSYSALYEDYANLLEGCGRRQEADDIYQRGIKKGARPLERLKTRYKEFRNRGSLDQEGPGTAVPSSRSNAATSSSRSEPVSSSRSPPTLFNSTAASRYALMLAPPAPGKRPEKLRFNMNLLFTEEGVEYSIQEARARSMGLLGKKWAPPPISDRYASSSSVVVADDARGTSRARITGRKSVMGGAEPTMTINTKEALADVFGMYNSPDKTTKLPGSKHAPVKKIEPVTPLVPPRIVFARENENSHNAKTPVPAFRPFSDENALNSAKTPVAKITPFVDADQKTPFVTPRAVLSVKDSAPSTVSRQGENAPETLWKPQDGAPEAVFAKVFTPASKSVPLAPLRDVFTDDHGQPVPKAKPTHTHERAKSQHDAFHLDPENPRPPTFTPFKEENARTPFKVFSRPPDKENQNMYTPKTPSATFVPLADKTPAFTPFKDAGPAFTPFTDAGPKPVLQPVRTPAFSPQDDVVGNETVNEDVEPEMQEHEQYTDYYEEEQEEQEEPEEQEQYEEEESQMEEYEPPLPAEHLPEVYEEGESYQHDVPLGGRFGQFSVMTPITERTFEYTSSTRVVSTPSMRYGGLPDAAQRAQHEAKEAALRLEQELRESDEEQYDQEYEYEQEEAELEPLQLSTDSESIPEAQVAAVEERTGSLSLLDTLTLSSRFRPSNPCNPFDPAIISALMTRIPADPNLYDLRNQQRGMLDELQKFTKKVRKTSGSGVDRGSFSLTLEGHRFLVTEKLGEGGFGCVFKARDVGLRMGAESDEDEDEDEDEDDDEDEDAVSMIALKVVKPRNLWEYTVLRRLHTALPPALRRSVILPHALYAFADESHLVLDLCPQGMLLNIVNNAVSAGVSQAGACLDELLVVFFTIELLRLLEAMHATGFIHGDLKIDNLLLRLEDVPGGAAAWSGTYQPSGDGGWSYKGLKVIDFGRTIDMRLFPLGQQFIADWDTDDRDCFEVRENRPWTYQTDYFGLAGVVYCMLFGKYIQANSVVQYVDEDGVQRYKIATPFKRYWQTDTWSRLFDVLLNPCLVRPGGELPVCDALNEIRKEMEQWLQANCNRTSNTLKGLLKKVELSCYKL